MSGTQLKRTALLMSFLMGITSPILWADDSHIGHSDDLLLLIQQKIALKKLQADLRDNQLVDIQSNLNKQDKILKQALHRLEGYVALSSGHYPNDSLYQQSLENRAAMLKEFAELLSIHHFQAGHLTSKSVDPDGGQHSH